MSQEWTSNSFASGHVAQTDLQNMEKNFACLKSGFSGAAAPANTEGGMRWFDTTKKVFKIRNNGDTAWYGLMHGDGSEKRLVYRNVAMDGYLRDATVTDKVIALRGGAIYLVGGDDTQGTWTQPDHVHKWYDSIAAAIDKSYDSAGVATNITTAVDAGNDLGIPAYQIGGVNSGLDKDFYVEKKATVNTYRPAAAVCILVYLDL